MSVAATRYLAYGCFVAAAALLALYAATRYRQAQKPIAGRNIVLFAASAIWVAVGGLELYVASLVEGGAPNQIRPDVCLAPIASGVSCWALVSHFRSLKTSNRVPVDSGGHGQKDHDRWYESEE
jgi:hypothetical protein